MKHSSLEKFKPIFFLDDIQTRNEHNMIIEGNSASESINRSLLQSEYLFARGEIKNSYRHINDLLLKYKDSQYIGRIKTTLGILLINEDRIYEAENNLKEAEIICRSTKDHYGLIKNLLAISFILNNFGQTYESLEMVREATDICLSFNLHELFPMIYYYECRYYWNLGELQVARNYCLLGISQLESGSIKEDHLYHWRLYSMKGVIYRAMGEPYQSVLDCYNKALDIALGNFLLDALPTIYNNISYLLKVFGKPGAKYFLEKCIQISEEFNKSRILSTAYQNMAEIYADQGKYILAHSFFEKALALKLSLGYKGISKASVYSQLAILERNFGHINEAVEHFKESLKEIEFYQIQNDKPGILAQYALTLLRINRDDEAIEKINEAKEILTKQQRDFPSIIYIADGLYSLIIEGPELALQYFFKAYTLAKEKLIPLDIVEAALFIIKCYLSLYSENYKIKHFLQAQKYIGESLEIAKNSNLYPQIINIELLKAGFHLAEFNYGEALTVIVDAINKANELGFTKESDDGRRFIQQINIAIRRMGDLSYNLSDTSTPDIPFFQTGTLVSYINKLINIPEQNIKPNEFILLVFKFTSTGPEPIFMHPELEENRLKSTELILNLGVLLTYLMGQGQNYFQGLYGPIPIKGFEKINNSAIIFSALVNDSTINEQDARMEGKNYTIFCFVYPQKYDNTFISRIDMNDIFTHFKNNHKDLALWTDDDLEDLRNTIINLVVKSQL